VTTHPAALWAAQQIREAFPDTVLSLNPFFGTKMASTAGNLDEPFEASP